MTFLTVIFASAPLDVAPVASEIVSYILGGAASGLVVLLALYGLAMIIKAFAAGQDSRNRDEAERAGDTEYNQYRDKKNGN